MKELRKEIIEKLIENILENPLDWIQTSHTYFNKVNKIEIWTANGFSCLCIYKPEEIKLTFLERWELSKAIKKAKEKKILQTIQKNINENN